MSAPLDATIDLLQHCIRAACVNDGTPNSGGEARSASMIETFLDGSGLEIEGTEPVPGRRSVVARLRGSDPSAPKLCLLGHLDVVPAPPEGWRHDPFGGELIDGEIWGRGSIDMLNLTCTMAAAVRQMSLTGRRPRGDVIFAAVADEEAGGTYGAEHLLRARPDMVDADYVITESGGISMNSTRGHGLTITVAEKGAAWRRLTVHGTPGHASAPFRADNALVTAAEIIGRLASHRAEVVVDDNWRTYVAALDIDDELVARMRDPALVDETLSLLSDPVVCAHAHACSRTTIAPTIVHGGTKTNVIPDSVTIELDIRPMPGVSADEIDAMLLDIIGGDLSSRVTIEPLCDIEASSSPTATPLFDILADIAQRFFPLATLVPVTTPGGTDALHFRRAGAVAYGFGMFSRRMTPGEFRSRFHARNERIDVESLAMTADAWEALLNRW